MKIILINPPSPFLISQKDFSPLGILYLASVLRENNFEVEVLDLANKEDQLESVLKPLEADIYGISATTPQYPLAKKILKILKKTNLNVPVVIGGAHPSSIPNKCLADGFDYVVVGEGEQAMLNIALQYQDKEPIKKIIRCPYIRNIDTIPKPARDLIDLKSYGYDVDGHPAISLITSRGCPYDCAFCSKDVWQRSVRFHSPEYVVDELNEIINDFGFTHFLFLDDSLALNKKRLVRICDLIEPLNIKWRCYMRTNGITKEILKRMKQAGCSEIGFGIESGSQRILDIVNKKTKVKENLKVVKYCKEIGITTNVFIMIGLPQETHKTVEETKNWMEKAKPDKFGFNIFAPYVGTRIYNHPEEYDITLSEMPDGESWIKGKQGEYRSFVSTSELSSDEILRLFTELFKYYTKLTHWQPGIGKKRKKYPFPYLIGQVKKGW
ncbi:MAG: B12-binding domain-containing radical SAM protein [Candidatus Omnitrophica bacterium]|nr:B12-binding domain-containing radical SAM protein [Candidatus Omnitrophota bacterium]